MSMTVEQQVKIINLNKGKTIGAILYRLDIIEQYIQHRQLAQRLKLVGLTIGD